MQPIIFPSVGFVERIPPPPSSAAIAPDIPPQRPDSSPKTLGRHAGQSFFTHQRFRDVPALLLNLCFRRLARFLLLKTAPILRLGFHLCFQCNLWLKNGGIPFQPNLSRPSRFRRWRHKLGFFVTFQLWCACIEWMVNDDMALIRENATKYRLKKMILISQADSQNKP